MRRLSVEERTRRWWSDDGVRRVGQRTEHSESGPDNLIDLTLSDSEVDHPIDLTWWDSEGEGAATNDEVDDADTAGSHTDSDSDVEVVATVEPSEISTLLEREREYAVRPSRSAAQARAERALAARPAQESEIQQMRALMEMFEPVGSAPASN